MAKNNDNFLIGEEFKEPGNKLIIGKHEHDLFYEENDTINKVIRVKRFSLPNKGERWKIFVDNKITFIIEGTKISKKERLFLQTVDGCNFMLSLAKIGISSMSHFKTEIKKNMQLLNNKDQIDK